MGTDFNHLSIDNKQDVLNEIEKIKPFIKNTKNIKNIIGMTNFNYKY